MVDLIVARGELTIAELASHFQISAPTIRRDLAVLAQAGLAARSRGGVLAPGKSGLIEPLFMEKLRVRQALKTRIGRAAAQRVLDRQRVLLDSGTTALAVARALAGRNVSIVTMDLKVAEAAASGATQVALIGGQLRNGFFSIVGPWALNALSQVRCDLFFMGCDAIDPDGISNSTAEEAEVKCAGMASAARTVLIADHSKLDSRSLVPVCSLEAIDCLITDRKAIPRLDAYRPLIHNIEAH